MARPEIDIAADLATVRTAMASPSYVMFADRAVTNRSLAELRQRESDLLAELATVQRTTRPKQTLIVASKGL